MSVMKTELNEIKVSESGLQESHERNGSGNPSSKGAPRQMLVDPSNPDSDMILTQWRDVPEASPGKWLSRLGISSDTYVQNQTPELFGISARQISMFGSSAGIEVPYLIGQPPSGLFPYPVAPGPMLAMDMQQQAAMYPEYHTATRHPAQLYQGNRNGSARSRRERRRGTMAQRLAAGQSAFAAQKMRSRLGFPFSGSGIKNAGRNISAPVLAGATSAEMPAAPTHSDATHPRSMVQGVSGQRDRTQ